MAKWTGILMAGQQRVTTVAMKRDKHGNILEYKMEPELDAMKSIQQSHEEWQEIFKRERERLVLRSKRLKVGNILKAAYVRCGDKYRSFDIDDGVFDATEHCQSVIDKDKTEAPKPLPNGATIHKALPAACLEPLDDRAAFIGRWEQKIV